MQDQYTAQAQQTLRELSLYPRPHPDKPGRTQFVSPAWSLVGAFLQGHLDGTLPDNSLKPIEGEEPGQWVNRLVDMAEHHERQIRRSGKLERYKLNMEINELLKQGDIPRECSSYWLRC